MDSSFNNIFVNISQNAMNRIYYSVLNSNVEEGGKLIGNIDSVNGNITATIMSYIDSGPKVSKSSTHLLPDCEYQEKVFHLLESFDYSIDHIGSWHSHHCNGLKTLSDGDINGYYHSVNHPNYNLDYFIAILATEMVNTKLQLKYYLFIRGNNGYYEIDQSNINLIKHNSKSTRLLFLLDQINSQIKPRKRLGKSTQRKGNIFVDDVKLKQIRSIDNRWLKDKFSNVITKRNKITNVISWEWVINAGANKYRFVYSHPPFLGRIRKVASLRAFRNGQRVMRKKITLNSNRFFNIVKNYNRIIAKYC